MNLRIPGPTPCPAEVLAALGRQMINHRGPEMAALARSVVERLGPFFQTANDIVLLTGSGTAGLEAAVVNTLSPGDRVLGLSVGLFGDRFLEIAGAYGVEVRPLRFDWGRAVDPEAVRRALAENAYRAVLITHNETSTGVTNPLREICEVIGQASPALILVDAISSLAAIPLASDAWGVDLLVSGSQKAWGVPPGLAMVAVSPRAWNAAETARLPRYYLDLRRHRDALRQGQFPWTPAISILYALDAALGLMEREGRESIYARHALCAARTREALGALGLALFAEARFASNTVTAVRLPEGMDGQALTRRLREKYDTVVGGGQARLSGRIVRLGHLGFVQPEDMERAVANLGRALAELGPPAGR
jgi:aspartate aminotransferase-like enzyme